MDNSKYNSSYSEKGLWEKIAKYKKGIEDFNEVIKLNKNNEKAYLIRGIAKAKLGKYEESIEDFNEAIKLNKNNEDAYFYRGVVKADLKLYKESIDDLKNFSQNKHYIQKN